MEFDLEGVAADSCFTASYGGTLVIRPAEGAEGATLVGNAFGYGARGGNVYIAGRAGNRFGICLRKSHEGTGPRIVVEGVEANGFQYMTGGRALVLGSVGRNLGSGMTGGCVYILDLDPIHLNEKYVLAVGLNDEDIATVRVMLKEHSERTGSRMAACLDRSFDAGRFSKVMTKLEPEAYV
jgi:glutamate synthase domain-containing protein 3